MNRNVPVGRQALLGSIGGLPTGTPVAFGWGWLSELPQNYGFEPHLAHPLQCKAIASARPANNRVGPSAGVGWAGSG
ncbi:hypothetical protein [Streptomyces sp. CoH17]|uniref:hypothetical protein n=1 Tax=Streptomyces sp. CoH17 TaxID=2992806 RepID=UPI00226DC0FE|nr:hypothetical protein [Streptomyces sp. CoH17]